MSHPVFGPAFSLGQTCYPVHLLLVPVQQCDVVSDDQKIGHFQVARGGALKRALRFGEAVCEEIARGETGILKRVVGIGCDLFLGCLNGSRKSARSMGGKAPQQTQRVWLFTSWIGLKP